jgi:autotransporter-associated beta strand protein
MKNLVTSLLLTASLFAAGTAPAFIAGPYTADQYTLHLWHLDETATPCVDSVASGGMNLLGLSGGAMLGNPSYSASPNNLGNALNTAPGGSGKADLLSASATAANVTLTVADTATGAFTFEAVVQIGFDPTATSTTLTYQIMSGESGSNPNRIFQWRLVPKGFTLVAGVTSTQPCMTFENVRMVSGNQATIYAPIPITGPDAIVSNGWYHVAVTYNGLPNTANNIIFYWTAMDPSRIAADPLTITSTVNSLNGLNPTATITTPFMLGNQARNKNGNFLGMIDEVRISKIARGPSSMMFQLPTINLTPLASQFVPVGSTLALSSIATGGLPISYQWKFNGTNLPGSFTNMSGINTNTLVVSNITFDETGIYSLYASNASSATNVSATITVGNPVAGLYGTGLTSTGALQLGGQPDGNWQLIQSADPTYTGPQAIVDSSIPATYVANSSTSQWIAPGDNVSSASGNYEYATSFVLDSENTNNMQVILNWAADNVCMDIFLNGADLGATNFNGYASFVANVITNHFVAGTNTLVCLISNGVTAGVNLTGFRADVTAISVPLPPAPIQLLYPPADASVNAGQNATFTVTVYGSGPISYQWYSGATLLAGQTGRALTLNNVNPSQDGTYSVTVANSLSTNSYSAALTVTVPDMLEWSGAASADWDLFTVNWVDTNTSSPAAFSQNVNVLFDNAGSGQSSVSLDVPLSPNSVTVSAANNYTFGGSGYLAGNLNLTEAGPGTLVMDTANTYTGNTVISGGVLQVGNYDGKGTLGSSSVTDEADLVFTTPATNAVPNPISGPGAVTMNGTGIILLTGNNSGFTGPTAVNSGTLTPRNAAALGSGAGATTVVDGAQVFIDENINFPAQPFTIGGVGNGNGALHKGGAGSTYLGGPITLSDYAGIGLDGNSSLFLTNPAAITGADVPLATQLGAGATLTISGAVNLGNGGYTQYGPASGASTVIMSSTGNNWTGGTLLNTNCTLQIGDGGPDGSIGTGGVSDGGALTFLSSGTLTLSQAITGPGVVNQSGSGILLLSGGPFNGFGGAIHINNNGVLQLAPGESLTGGSLTIGAGQGDTNCLELTGNDTVSIPIAIFPRAYLGTLGANLPTVNYPNIVNVSGTNTVSPTAPVAINSGGNLFSLESDSGYLIYNGGVLGNGAARDFALQGAGSGELDGPITQSAGQSINVYVLGSGTWKFNGMNSYTGVTLVSNGLMVVSGTISNSPVTVWGGTLAGTGLLTGPVTIAAGATLAPTVGTHSGIGTMTMQGTLTLQPGSITSMQINKGAASSDLITGLSTTTLGGILNITNLSGTLTAGDSFELFAATNYAGAFTAINPATPGPGLRWDLAGVSIGGLLRVFSTNNVAAPTIATSSVSGSVLTLTGTGGTANDTFLILTSTNLQAPLSTWTQVGSGAFDGSGNFSATAAVPGAKQSFFVVQPQ